MYLVYVDESGRLGYDSMDKDPILVLGAVVVHESRLSNLQDGLGKYLDNRFGAGQGEVKAQSLKAILAGHEPKGRLAELTARQRKNLVRKVFDAFTPSSITCLAAAVDKPGLKARYGDSAWLPYNAAFGVLVLQVCELLATVQNQEKALDGPKEEVETG